MWQKDGALSRFQEQTGGISVDENELKQYLETVIHLPKKRRRALAQNQKNAERDCRQH